MTVASLVCEHANACMNGNHGDQLLWRKVATGHATRLHADVWSILNGNSDNRRAPSQSNRAVRSGHVYARVLHELLAVQGRQCTC